MIDAASDRPALAARASGAGGSARVRRALETLRVLTESDLRARYGRGPWRLAKWLLDPFAAVGVYLVLVTAVLDRTGPAPGLALACAVVPFQLVMMGLVSGIACLRLRRSIVLNMHFDRSLIPLSALLTECVAFTASFALIAMMMAIYGIGPTPALAWLPLVLLVNVALAISIAYLGALFGLWFADLRVFAVSFMRTLFFVSSGLVPLALVSGRAADLLKLNPLTGLFEAYRDAILYGQRPAAWELLVPLGFALVLLAVSLPVYRREQDQLAKVMG